MVHTEGILGTPFQPGAPQICRLITLAAEGKTGPNKVLQGSVAREKSLENLLCDQRGVLGNKNESDGILEILTVAKCQNCKRFTILSLEIPNLSSLSLYDRQAITHAASEF